MNGHGKRDVGEPRHFGIGIGKERREASFGRMHHSVSKRGTAISLQEKRKIKFSLITKAVLSQPAPNNRILNRGRSGNCSQINSSAKRGSSIC